MAYKLISFILLVALASQGHAQVQEIRLEDRVVNHMTNPLIGFGIQIPHLILDTLEACTVTFPNGLTYEIFPNSNVPNSVSVGTGVFPACGINFRNAPVSMSGVYELMALTTHWPDDRRTLQRQRFDIRLTEPQHQD